MLDKIQKLINDSSQETASVLEVLIEICTQEALDYCNQPTVTKSLEAAIVQMVIEKYNKMGEEGMSQSSSNGITNSYADDYSPAIMRLLQKNRKIKVVV